MLLSQTALYAFIRFISGNTEALEGALALFTRSAEEAGKLRAEGSQRSTFLK